MSIFFRFHKRSLFSAGLLLFTSLCLAQSIEAIDGESDKRVFFKLNKGLECVFIHDNVLVTTEGRLIQVDSAEFKIEDAIGQTVTIPINRVVRLQKCSCKPREQRDAKWPNGYYTIAGLSRMSTQYPNRVVGRMVGTGIGVALGGVSPIGSSVISAANSPNSKAPPSYKYWEFIAHPEPE
jgi:hypothetical protein